MEHETDVHPEQRARELLEIVEDRYGSGSIMITSQIPVLCWHDMIGVPPLAHAILDRVIHNAYRIDLSGDSLRKQRSWPASYWNVWLRSGPIQTPRLYCIEEN